MNNIQYEEESFDRVAGCSRVIWNGSAKNSGTAVVKSKTEITFPENANRQADGEGDGGGAPTGMESKNTVYFTKDFIKTYNETDFGNNT